MNTADYAKDIQIKLGLRETPVVFSTLEAAMSFARLVPRTVWVSMLNCPAVAIVYRLDDVKKLENAGYEIPFTVRGSMVLQSMVLRRGGRATN